MSDRQIHVARSIKLQASGELEQEIEKVEVPLALSTPSKAESRQGDRHQPTPAPAPANGIASPAVYSSLADRLKTRKPRRSVHHSSTQLPSAAVHSLAETVDAAIAPDAGASERYLDRQDANHNVPENIPGASDEQVQHRSSLPASAPQLLPGRTGVAEEAAIASNGVATPAKGEAKRARKGSKSAILHTAAEVASGPDVSEDVLQEDQQVTKRRRSRKQLQVEDATHAVLAQPERAAEQAHPGTSNIKKARQHKSKHAAVADSKQAAGGGVVEDRASIEVALEQIGSPDHQSSAAVVAPNNSGGRKRPPTNATAVEAVNAAVAAVTQEGGVQRQAKKQRIKACEIAVSTETVLEEPVEKGRKRQNRHKKEVDAIETDIVVEGTEEGADVKVTKRRSRARAANTKPEFEMPSRDILEQALQWQPTERPIPNLGYACLCMHLREQRPPIFTNRDMIQKTFRAKGLPYVSELALENVRAMKALVQWNHEHNIRFFRMTSNMLPWCTAYSMEELPDFPAIAEELAFAGKLARAYQQRLTFHPSHFVKLGGPLGDKQGKGEQLLQRSCKELEVHSQILDLMGYEPSHWNKVNIHIGGVYGNKEETLERWAQGFQRLSDNCKKRLTLENDDWQSAFSVKDLLPLSQRCNIPIVFDFHHHKFCSGGWTEKEAFFAALETWPKDVRPVVHWSESQEDRRPSAHSDYIQGPMNLYGKEADVDVMIEAKCMERTLLRFRDEIMGKPTPSDQI